MKQLFLSFLLLFFLVFTGEDLGAQPQGNLSFGAGFPELLNIAVQYRISAQAETGLSLGWWPPSKPGIVSWTNLFSLSGDLLYHFGGTSEYTTMHPWYVRHGLNCIMEEGGWWFTYVRVGREFNVIEECGIRLDAGLFYHINHQQTGIISFFASPSISWFYRF